MKDSILAKSDGTTLMNHSPLVSRIAVEIAKQTMLDSDEDLLEAVRVGGLLHDIGKCPAQFQKKLSTIKGDQDVESKSKFRHNEVGWAFLSHNIHFKTDINQLILDVVYWHHGISNKMDSYSNNKVDITATDSKVMLDFLKSVIPVKNIRKNKDNRIQAPKYYLIGNDKDNMRRVFVRLCVISADRLASGSTQQVFTDEEITALISNSNLRLNKVSTKSHIFADNERFKLQEHIITEVGRTTVVKAPAGFGKTLVGMLWSLKRDKKLIWVCPRNIVAESVYKSVLEQLVNFKITNLSVELYLTGEVKKHNDNFTKAFSSDIVITNIDNFLKPTVENGVAHRLHTIIDSDVIFDEFHELISEMGLFACFANLMRIRHQLTRSHTMLLSATPTNIHELWEPNKHNKSTILPNDKSHYKASHDKKYKLNIVDELNILKADTNNLIILNGIGSSQRNKEFLDIPILIHSNFMEKDKDRIVKTIFDNYDSHTPTIYNKPDVIGTSVIQASLDVSFGHLYEFVMSPESTLQRIGRCDRWGTYPEQATLNLFKYRDGSETATIKTLYNTDLSTKWFDYISKYDGEELTLDQLYVIYNKFNEINKDELSRFIKSRHESSLFALSKIHPTPSKNWVLNKEKQKVVTCDGNKLRSSNADTFCICKIYDTDEFTEPYSVSLDGRTNGEVFREDNSTRIKMVRIMKHFQETKDPRFDYEELLKDASPEKIILAGKNSDTPYIVFHETYHPEYGIIGNEELNELLTIKKHKNASKKHLVQIEA